MGLFNSTTKGSVQSSVHPPPKSGFRASALSFTSLSSIIYDVHWTQSGNWVGRLVASCANLDNAHLPILPGKYFFHSSQRLLSAWYVLVYHQHYISNLQVILLFPPFLPRLSIARNSSLHRFQNILTRFWTILHRFLGLNASSSIT